MSKDEKYTLQVFSSEAEFYKGNLYQMCHDGFRIKERGIASVLINDENLKVLQEGKPFLFLDITGKPMGKHESGLAVLSGASCNHGSKGENYLPVRIFSSID